MRFEFGASVDRIGPLGGKGGGVHYGITRGFPRTGDPNIVP